MNPSTEEVVRRGLPQEFNPAFALDDAILQGVKFTLRCMMRTLCALHADQSHVLFLIFLMHPGLGCTGTHHHAQSTYPPAVQTLYCWARWPSLQPVISHCRHSMPASPVSQGVCRNTSFA